MADSTVRISIPFESLSEAIAALSVDEKRRLLELLEEELTQAEEEAWEQSPEFRAQVQAARDAYADGDYVTLDEYVQRQKKPQ